LRHSLHHHLPLEPLAQFGHRHPLLLERGFKLDVVFELVFLLDVVHRTLELLVAQLQSELAPALHEQHLVDGVDEELRCEVVQHLAELRVARSVLRA